MGAEMHRVGSWLGHAFMAAMIAGLFAVVPFWTHGLTLDQATKAAVVIFPLVIFAYTFAIWRERKRDHS
jgi:formate/nitrite transporter FocA (FNT family)